MGCLAWNGPCLRCLRAHACALWARDDTVVHGPCFARSTYENDLLGHIFGLPLFMSRRRVFRSSPLVSLASATHFGHAYQHHHRHRRRRGYYGITATSSAWTFSAHLRESSSLGDRSGKPEISRRFALLTQSVVGFAGDGPRRSACLKSKEWMLHWLCFFESRGSVT